MKEQKYTPGPWSWQPQGNNKHILPRHYKLNAFSGRGLAVKVLEAEDEVWPKHPDARLIAAAPELLEALQAEEKRQWALRNLEAISDPLDPRLPAYRFEVEKTSHEANTLRRAAIAKATKPEADATLAARNNQPEKV